MYGKLKCNIREIIRKLCNYKNVEIVKGTVLKKSYSSMFKIPQKLSVSEFMGYLKEKNTLMIFDIYSEFKSKENRKFCASGYYVDTVGKNEITVLEYIRNQYTRNKTKDNLRY